MTVMQRLYDSEINFVVSAFYDDGFYVKLGDEMNGFQAEGRCSTWAVEEWLAGMARIHYPTSALPQVIDAPDQRCAKRRGRLCERRADVTSTSRRVRAR